MIDLPATLLAQNEPYPLDVIAVDPANGDSTNWIRGIITDIVEIYQSLTPEQRTMVDPRISQPIYLIEPFVEVAMSQLSGGLTDSPDAFVALRSTDDLNWSIGCALRARRCRLSNGCSISNSYGTVTASPFRADTAKSTKSMLASTPLFLTEVMSGRTHTTNSISLDLTRRSTPMPWVATL